MNNRPDPDGDVAAPVIVEDLFLTDVFLIKGRLQNKTKRLSNMLEDHQRSYLSVEDATLVSLRSNEVICTPKVMVNVRELICAHELVDVAGDDALRRLADNDKQHAIRAFYNGAVQFELSGRIEAGAYDSQLLQGRDYFIMQSPRFRGLDLSHEQLAVLGGLDYAILRKDRMAYIYDFA
ncbi:MAG: hypothetical protein ACON4Z_05765 [Planctomycetota bacterium]